MVRGLHGEGLARSFDVKTMHSIYLCMCWPTLCLLPEVAGRKNSLHLCGGYLEWVSG